MDDSKSVVDTLVEREGVLYVALTASDAETLGDVMSDDLLYIHSSGIAETKAENLAGQRSGLYVHGPIVRKGGDIKIFGDVAVVSGPIDMVDSARGSKTMLRLQQSLIWVKEGNIWRLLVRAATRLGH